MSEAEAAQTTEAAASDQTMLGQAQATTEAPAEGGAAAGTEAKPETTAKDQQTDGEAKPEGEEKPKEGEGEAEKKPIEYADFKLPDGMTIDSPVMEDAKKLFAADGLSQDQAQKYVDLYTGKLKEASEAPYLLWAQTQKEWQDQVKADKEIGGAKLAENLGVAAKALDRFGGNALRQALDASGAGNHPEVIRAFIRIGKAISEDSLVLGRSAVQDDRSRAERLYPNDPLKPRD